MDTRCLRRGNGGRAPGASGCQRWPGRRGRWRSAERSARRGHPDVRAARLPITRPERFGQSDTVKVLLIAVAGAAGALARYGIGTAVGPRDFPWQTLGINLAGSFALGF